MSAAAEPRRALLEAQADVLSRLEEVVAEDERRVSSGQPGSDAERSRLLRRLEEIASALRASTATGEPLEASNRERARALWGRTEKLLESWRIRRDLLRSALGELRGGKRLVEALRGNGRARAGLDLRR